MARLYRSFRAISPVLAVLMMIAIAIAGALVVYAWIMGYIGFSFERSGEAITIPGIANDPTDTDLLVYVQNIGEKAVQLEENGCLYVDGILVECIISAVTVSDDTGTLSEGETATLRYLGGATLPGEKVTVKVLTLAGTSAEKSAYPAGSAHTPPVSIMWNQTYGGTAADVASSLVATSDGGYAMAGYTQSFGAGDYDFLLVKTDGYGIIEWNQTYGGPDIDFGLSLVATSDGGYALAGQTASFGAGDSDFWLIKTDGSGYMEWNQTYGGANEDSANSLVATSDGGYALAGATRSFAGGSNDFWLIKTDGSGYMEWNQTYGGTDFDEAYSLVATSDGGYALTGTIYYAGAGDSDCWLIKTDSYGNMEWNQTYEGPATDGAYSLIETSDGGYALAGQTASFGAGGYDVWLIKTDAVGNMEWNQTYGGPERESAYSLVEMSDGGYALAGYTESFGAGGYDFWLIKTDGSGYMEWNQTYGGANEDSANSLVATSDGGYALAGPTYSFGVEGGNFWLVKTDEYGSVQ